MLPCANVVLVIARTYNLRQVRPFTDTHLALSTAVTAATAVTAVTAVAAAAAATAATAVTAVTAATAVTAVAHLAGVARVTLRVPRARQDALLPIALPRRRHLLRWHQPRRVTAPPSSRTHRSVGCRYSCGLP